jgi:hypothetical protein
MGKRWTSTSAALKWICGHLWRWDVVGIGAPLIYAAGIGALYGDDYIIAAALFFAGIAWITAKALSWEETRNHPNQRGVSLIFLVFGVVAFTASLLWIRHREVEMGDHKPPTAALIPVTINWDDPAPIVVGTALSGAQLNAVPSVESTSTYDPDIGKKLPVGKQPLTVTFTPKDTTKYSKTSKTVYLVVNPPTSLSEKPRSPRPSCTDKSLKQYPMTSIAQMLGEDEREIEADWKVYWDKDEEQHNRANGMPMNYSGGPANPVDMQAAKVRIVELRNDINKKMQTTFCEVFGLLQEASDRGYAIQTQEDKGRILIIEQLSNGDLKYTDIRRVGTTESISPYLISVAQRLSASAQHN